MIWEVVMKDQNVKQKSPVSWIMTFAGRYKKLYTTSVAAAAAGVVCGVIPYFIMGDVIHRLVEGNRNWQDYLTSESGWQCSGH